MEFSRRLVETSGYDREGFAARYDRHRPRPPAVLLDVLCRYARVDREAFADDTGLEEASADIVTCSQSLHWMDPGATFAEAARILRPGGVFAAYDYNWPPVIDPEVDEAFDAYQRRRGEMRARRGIQRGADRWAKTGHLERMRESGHFRFCRELLLHSIEDGGADRIVGFAYSLGLPAAIDDPELERELRVAELEEVARRVLGDRTVPFHFGYRVRVGVR
jgi:SAM-dependent methyltransferase